MWRFHGFSWDGIDGYVVREKYSTQNSCFAVLSEMVTGDLLTVGTVEFSPLSTGGVSELYFQSGVPSRAGNTWLAKM